MKTAQQTSAQRTLQGLDTIKYEIDAAGMSLGRVASDAAQALLGKKSAHYVQNFVLPVEVTIKNAAQLVISEKKAKQKEYIHYTGFTAGLRSQTLEELREKKGIEEVVRIAVDGMIPRNKLRKERMKRLTITA